MGFADLIATADSAVLSHLGAVDVVYQPSVGDPVTVQGLYDENYTLIDEGNNAVEQIGPAVWLTLSALPADPQTDDPTITIQGREYRVRERQTDGFGGTVRLLLLRADL